MSILPNLTFGFDTVQIKISASYFMDINNSKVYVAWLKTRRANRTVRKNKAEDWLCLTERLTVRLRHPGSAHTCVQADLQWTVCLKYGNTVSINIYQQTEN